MSRKTSSNADDMLFDAQVAIVKAQAAAECLVAMTAIDGIPAPPRGLSFLAETIGSELSRAAAKIEQCQATVDEPA